MPCRLPTQDSRLAQQQADAALHVGAERATVKSYSLRKQDGGQDQFVAYLLPMEPPRGADDAGPSRCLSPADPAFNRVRSHAFLICHCCG